MSNRALIGYEISDCYAQMSVLNKNEEEPQTIAMGQNAETYHVPVALYYDHQNQQWHLTKQVEDREDKEQLAYFDHLWSGAVKNEEIECEGEVFSAVSLLAIFIKCTFSQLYLQTALCQFDGIMFTVPEIGEAEANMLKRLIPILGVKAKQIQYQSNTESFCTYVCHQPEEIWNHQVLAFDGSKGYLKEYCFSSNRYTSPRILTVDEKVYGDFFNHIAEEEEYCSREFLNIAKVALEDKVVTGVYLIGDVMAEEWTKAALPELCRNRKVFLGSNLFSKGACFAMQDKRLAGKPWEQGATTSFLQANQIAGHDYVYLGKDQLKWNIGMEVFQKGQKVYVPLLSGEENWYDAQKEMDMILKSENAFSIFVTPLNGRNKKEMIMTLDGLPVEKDRICRIRMKIWASSVNQIHMELENMGFGEFFPKTTQIWKETFEL